MPKTQADPTTSASSRGEGQRDQPAGRRPAGAGAVSALGPVRRPVSSAGKAELERVRRSQTRGSGGLRHVLLGSVATADLDRVRTTRQLGAAGAALLHVRELGLGADVLAQRDQRQDVRSRMSHRPDSSILPSDLDEAAADVALDRARRQLQPLGDLHVGEVLVEREAQHPLRHLVEPGDLVGDDQAFGDVQRFARSVVVGRHLVGDPALAGPALVGVDDLVAGDPHQPGRAGWRAPACSCAACPRPRRTPSA